MKTKKTDTRDTGRFWEGLPVREAVNELRIFASAEDASGAHQKDWGNCVFARACLRLYGSKRVAFFRTIAYVELVDEKGTAYIERFSMPKSLREQIERFDKTRIAPPGGFTLKPIDPHNFLNVKSAKNKLAQKRRRAKIVGGSTNQDYKKPNPIRLDWRSGTGMVHFHAKNAISPANGKHA